MLDYEEYGSSFRTPRALRPNGGPANNGMGYDTTSPEGRPPSEDDPTQRPKVPGLSSAPASVTEQRAPMQTFAQLQAQGLPRPPAPTGGVSVYTGGPVNQSMAPPGGLITDPRIPSGLTPSPQPDAQGQIYGDWQTERNRGTVAQPDARYTGQFSGDPSGGALGGRTEQEIMRALGQPSRYDAGVVKDSFGYLSGAIDDDYNQRDNALKESIASRGLGAVGDGSIGTGSQINQNLSRRTAKQNLASELLREQANTYGSDRSSAIAAAMGYGGQRFGQGLSAFNANRGANEGNFEMDLRRGQFGLDAEGQRFQQRRGALQDYTNWGRDQFDNQYRTSALNQQQQQEQQRLLMQLLGYQ